MALPHTNHSQDVGPWREWLALHFPHVCRAPFAPRHERLWEWFTALEPGTRPRARLEVWGRGGAKSSTGELGCAYIASKLSRRYVLYVSGVQDQADKHLSSVAYHLETLGIPRALNVYGASKGWRRTELRAANGFNISAVALIGHMRGAKLGEYRPDLIIFDDVDSNEDSIATVEKKIEIITTSILPAGSNDCAHLFLQNKIHADSIVSQLCDGRAEFLLDRELPFIEPSVIGLTTEIYDDEEGRKLFRITGGTPTWEGQNLQTCEEEINARGLKAFLKESQHEVEVGDGYVFNVNELRYCSIDNQGWVSFENEDHPALNINNVRQCRAWDLAATHDAGDHTSGAKVAITPNDRVIVVDVNRGQWDTYKVEREIARTAEADGSPKVTLRLPQDPAQAGKYQAMQFEEKFGRFQPVIKIVSGDKITRAHGFSQEVNKGNVWFARAPWNHPVREVLRRIKEDVRDQEDDDMDAISDAYNELKDQLPPMRGWIA